VRELGDGLWLHAEPFVSFGIPFGRLMVVARLPDGGLWIHSPAKLLPDLRARLDALGEVRFVVAPNAVHGHADMGDYREAYPGVELHAGPGLDVRRKDLVIDRLLGDVPDPRWSEVLDQASMLGHRLATEIEFLHRPSRTLITGDLVVNLPGPLPRAQQLWFGGEGGLFPPRLVRMDLRDRRQARASLDRILAWDFDRIVPGHGEVLESGGREALRRAYAFLG
jgi:hypothetical protein